MRRLLTRGLLLFVIVNLYAQEAISVVSYNVQNLFDTVTEGTEYPNIKNNEDWNYRMYDTRLERLSSVLKSLNADIYALEEVENEGVIEDIASKLNHLHSRNKRTWRYYYFQKNKGNAVGQGVISTYPISINRKEKEESSKRGNRYTRPIVKCYIKLPKSIKYIDSYGKTVTEEVRKKEEKEKEERYLVLFINHWKSKLGNKEAGEEKRAKQEEELATSMKEEIERGYYALAMGDFNMDVSEFSFARRGKKGSKEEDKDKVFNTPNIRLGGTIDLYNPYIDESGEISKEGSYYYRGNWERIDNFFSSSTLYLYNFTIEKGFWCNKNGRPNTYKTSGAGYSDHLPIKVWVKFIKD